MLRILEIIVAVAFLTIVYAPVLLIGFCALLAFKEKARN